MTLAICLSLLIGLLLGLLGGGGSILTVPMLVYVLKLDPKIAVVISLVVVGTSSLIAIIPHARRGFVCWKSGFFFGLAGMPGAYSGGRLAAYFSGDVLMVLFGVVTLVTGIAMLRISPASTTLPAMGEEPRACPLRTAYLQVLFDGFFVGLLTGLVGVGGGFLIVPALTILVGLPMQAAIGTSLLVIAMNALAGLGGYANHVSIDLELTAVITGCAVTGSILGGILSKRISTKVLRRSFGMFVLLVAGYVLHQSLTMAMLTSLINLLARHIEFLLGVATLALGLAFFRLGQWIHRHDNSISNFNH